MNILILTGKFGMGHNSAALAIKEQLLLENPNYNIEIIDFIEYMFPRYSKFIYNTFNFLTNKCHSIYNTLNNISSKSSTIPLKKFIIKKIDDLLNNYNTTTIISVFPLCSQYISAYKKMSSKQITLNTFITDVVAHKEWISNETNYYFVASLETKNYLLANNIPSNKIIISGIPVKQKFKKSIKLNKNKNILIMGGGLGLIPHIKEVLNTLNNSQNIKTTIITGHNIKLYKQLKNTYKNIEVIGFTNEVYKYMNNASLIITKPGGITLFEAINTTTPILTIKPFLNQEVGNAKFIEDKNIGIVYWNDKKLQANDIINLINNQSNLKVMQKEMNIIKTNLEHVSFSKYLERKDDCIC